MPYPITSSHLAVEKGHSLSEANSVIPTTHLEGTPLQVPQETINPQMPSNLSMQTHLRGGVSVADAVSDILHPRKTEEVVAGQSSKVSAPAPSSFVSDPSKADGGSLDYLNSLITTPERELKLERASKAKRGILAFGDALRHLGNVYYATRGAVPQKFNNPVEEERVRYKTDKAERDARNLKALSYRMQKSRLDRDAQKLNYDLAKLQNDNYWKKLGYEQNERKMKNDALNREEERKTRLHINEENNKFKAEQNQLNRETTIKAATIRKSGSNNGSTRRSKEQIILYDGMGNRVKVIDNLYDQNGEPQFLVGDDGKPLLENGKLVVNPNYDLNAPKRKGKSKESKSGDTLGIGLGTGGSNSLGVGIKKKG